MKRILTLLFALILTSSAAFADLPGEICYQGVLADAAGDAVSSGTYTITFKFHSAETGGTELWSETQAVDVDDDGLFNVHLGSVNAFSSTLTFDSEYWLGITVAGGSELPRIKILTAPFAMTAKRVVDGAITADMLDGASSAPGKARLQKHPITGEIEWVLPTVNVDGSSISGDGLNTPLSVAQSGIGENHLQDEAVTTDKIEDQAVDEDKIKHHSVDPFLHLTVEPSYPNKLLMTDGSGSFLLGDLTGSMIPDLSITSSKLADFSVDPFYHIQPDSYFTNVYLVTNADGEVDWAELSVSASDITPGSNNTWLHTNSSGNVVWSAFNPTIYSSGMLSGDGSSGSPVEISASGVSEGEVLKYESSAWTHGLIQPGNLDTQNDAGPPTDEYVLTWDNDINQMKWSPCCESSTASSTCCFDLPYSNTWTESSTYSSSFSAFNIWFEGLGWAISGWHAETLNWGYFGGYEYGAYGQFEETGNWGFFGSSEYGAYGKHQFSGNYGYLGSGEYGAYGYFHESGAFGYFGSGLYGGYARAYPYDHPYYTPYGFAAEYFSDRTVEYPQSVARLAGEDHALSGYYYDMMDDCSVDFIIGNCMYGFYASLYSMGGYAFYGEQGYSGIYGFIASSNYGVYGAYSLSGAFGYFGSYDYGAFGAYSASGAFGYFGSQDYGAYGAYNSSGNWGFFGSADFGAYGEHKSTGNWGYFGSYDYGAYGKYESNGNWGYFGSSQYGAYGQYSSSGAYGYFGSSAYGVYGAYSSSGNYGYFGSTQYGVYGYNTSTDTYAYLGGSYGVYGDAVANETYGVRGVSDGVSGAGVYGSHESSDNFAYLGGYSYGAYGEHGSSGNYGWLGGSNYGAYGYNSTSGNYGYLGGGTYGVYGINYNNNNWAYLGCNNYAFYAYNPTIGSGQYAGYFEGNVHVNGTLSKTGGSFKIDHPLDPENKYLVHSFVESPDMMNIYNGNVRLDENGEAWVELPDYFDAVNKDFRYQLTSIGAPGPNLYIAEEIADGKFKIAGGEPNAKVSWQITGVRNDPWARQNRIENVIEKTADERGKYLNPEVYDQPESKGLHIIKDENPK